MNKLLIALIAGAFATIAAAQNPVTNPSPMTKEKQQDVSATTQAGSGSSASTQKTAAEQAAAVKASKEVSKMTTAEKKAFAAEINKQMINPNNDAGTAATAKMQKETTAVSKATPKQNTELKTKQGQQQLSKELQEKSKNQ
ncbi:MAG TPA: hypothetical protein VMN56_18885 [Casimicrobiaceae bacterium]|nr:hypothetical protein [Casimicrobiaceae bacterium]